MSAEEDPAPDTSADSVGPDGSTLWYAALGYLIDEVVFIHREDRSIAFVSPSVTQVLGYTVDEYTSLSTPDLIHPDDLPEAARLAVELRAEAGASYRSVLRVRHADGGWVWVEILGRNLLHEPSVLGVVQTLRDISERRALEDELNHRAHHDDLTGLPNRNHFLDQLGVALAPHAGNITLLYIDLDGFKPVNDTHGHGAGDDVLRAIAGRLRQVTRDGDVCGRLGGDEFVAFFSGVSDEASAIAVGHRVLDALAGPVAVGGTTVAVGASVGVALPRPGDDADHLVSRADAALYAAKRAGGGDVVLAD